jgi:hypothetical protein
MSERTTIELFSDIVGEPGQDVIIQGVLDYKFAAFLPDSFLFDDPLDWLVTSFKVHGSEQLKTSLQASDIQVSLFHGGRCAPLLTQMTYKLTARPQKRGLRLRCAITGRFALNPGSTVDGRGGRAKQDLQGGT